MTTETALESMSETQSDETQPRAAAPRAAPGVFQRMARERVTAKLRAAIAACQNDDIEPARELIQAALDSADAASVTAILDTARTSVAMRAAPRTLARSCGRPVDEFLLIPFGRVELDRPLAGGDFEFTRDHAETLTTWFAGIDRRLAIDYEHQSFDQFNPRPDGLRPAAGWIGQLAIRADGLWATEVEWTDRSAALLGACEYQYFSPVIYWADEDYTRIISLGPVALTNDPAMRGVKPLTSGDALEGEPHAAAAPIAASRAPENVPDAADEIAALRRRLMVQEADTFVERGLRQGRIVASTSLDWRYDYLRDPAEAVARLARTPVVLPPGRIVEPGRDVEAPRPDVGSAGDSAMELEDLRAFERALTAGRVRGVRAGST